MDYDSCINAARKPGGEYDGGLRGHSAVNVVNPCTVTFRILRRSDPRSDQHVVRRGQRVTRDTFVFVPLTLRSALL